MCFVFWFSYVFLAPFSAQGVELLAKLGAPGAPGSGAALSAQQLALASLSAQLKVCEETLSQEVPRRFFKKPGGL